MNTKNIVEYAVTPETPKVQYGQQIYVHIPMASTFNKGIAQFDADYFDVEQGKVKLKHKLVPDAASILFVDALPVIGSSKVLYCVYNTLYEEYEVFIYLEKEAEYMNITKSILDVTNPTDAKSSNHLYKLTVDGLDTLCYLSQSGVMKILDLRDYNELIKQINTTKNELTEEIDAFKVNVNASLNTTKNELNAQLNTNNQQLNNKIDAVDEALGGRIDSAQVTASNASETSRQAMTTAADAATTADNAVELANSASGTAASASQVANNAADVAAQALVKAEEALNKSDSVTGGIIPKGSIDSIDNLPVASQSTLGFSYNINSAFTTTEQFVEGAGIKHGKGSNVVIVQGTNDTYKYDVFSGQVDVSELEEDVSILQSQMEDLLYKPITITAFSNNVGTQEIGTTITAVNLSWAFSKTPKTVTLDGVSKAIDSTGESLTGLSITANKSWTLKATDERDTVATSTTSISFLNGVYYGVASVPDTYDSAFILGLTKTLRSSKLTSFTANAGEGQYIYYCLPTRMGACSFKVGGFDGGFTLVGTAPFTNAKGYTEDYYIYKSDNANLGSTAVSVS